MPSPATSIWKSEVMKSPFQAVDLGAVVARVGEGLGQLDHLLEGAGRRLDALLGEELLVVVQTVGGVAVGNAEQLALRGEALAHARGEALEVVDRGLGLYGIEGPELTEHARSQQPVEEEGDVELALRKRQLAIQPLVDFRYTQGDPLDFDVVGGRPFLQDVAAGPLGEHALVHRVTDDRQALGGLGHRLPGHHRDRPDQHGTPNPVLPAHGQPPFPLSWHLMITLL
jgi:hypothetical protein